MVEWNNKTEGINKAGDPFRTIRENDTKRNVIASNDPHDEFDHIYWLSIHDNGLDTFNRMKEMVGNCLTMLEACTPIVINAILSIVTYETLKWNTILNVFIQPVTTQRSIHLVEKH